jgi:peptide deformylase
MAVKVIVKKGNPVLTRKSEAVNEIDNDILHLVQDLKDTLYSTSGVGLAAPQISVNKRVILVDLRNGMEPVVLINPQIRMKFGTQESEEGCLSYPSYYGLLKRPARITVKGIDENGKIKVIRAKELLCCALCHEIDHLDGIMFYDRAYKLYKDEDEKNKD